MNDPSSQSEHHCAMEITYLGTNTLLFIKNGSSILVDPHFTRPSIFRLIGKIRPDPQAIQQGLSSAGINCLDGVLLTHTHYDHALDTVEVLHQAGGMLYGSESAVNLARGSGLDDHQYIQVMPHQKYHVGAFQVRFHPGKHMAFPPPLGWLMSNLGEIKQPFQPPVWFWRYQCGRTFAIQVDQILIFGSAGFVAGAYQDLRIKTVIMGIGGLDLRSKTYLDQFYREAILHTQAQQVFLSHWDHFFQPLDRGLRPLILSRRTADRVRVLGSHYGQEVLQLKFGVPITIG